MPLFNQYPAVSFTKTEAILLGFALTRRGASRLFNWSKRNLRGHAPDGYLCLHGPKLEGLSKEDVAKLPSGEDQDRVAAIGKAWVCSYQFIGYD